MNSSRDSVSQSYIPTNMVVIYIGSAGVQLQVNPDVK